MSAAGSIAIPVSAGELIDRITILQIKAARFRDPSRAARARQDLDALLAIRAKVLPDLPALAEIAAQLQAVNEELWRIEDELRLCERQQTFGQEFIELARSVYRQNDRRGALKRQIDELVGSELQEDKQYLPYL